MKLRYSNFADRIDIDALEDALDIEPIDQTNNEDRFYCPLPWGLHSNGDTTGKFSINREKGVYNCWVCSGGSLLDLVMAMRNEEIEPAIKWLYQFANREETDEEFMEELDRLLSDPEDRQPTMPYFNIKALDRFSEPIEDAMDWDGDEAVPFLYKRGLDLAKLEFAHLGYCSRSYRPNKDVEYYGPSVCLPHFWNNRLVGWQQRWLDHPDDRPKHVPKYTMTPDFPKNETLWGFDYARMIIRNNSMLRRQCPNFVIVVESVPSALYLWSNNFPAIATFGSNVSQAQLKLLRCFTQIVLAPDNDPAGIKWRDGITEYLERFVQVRSLPLVGSLGSDIGDIASMPEGILTDYIGLAEEAWEYKTL